MRRLPAQPYCEATLVALLRSGHPRAFDQLYGRFAPGFLTTLRRIVGDQPQVEDLLQDSFIKIWLHLASYNPEKGRLFTWMLNIVRRTAFDYLKANRSQKTQPFDNVLLELAGTELPFDQAIGVVDWVNSTLNADLKEVIEYAYFRDLSHVELAKALDLPLGTAKVRIRRALRLLRANV